jgi:hypothetical protein
MSRSNLNNFDFAGATGVSLGNFAAWTAGWGEALLPATAALHIRSLAEIRADHEQG